MNQYQNQSVCPNCGYCPHCGRGGFHVLPYWQQPPIWYSTPYSSISGGDNTLGGAYGGLPQTQNSLVQS